MARLARKLATEHIIDPLFLESFLVCKLIPSNKCPGIRAIGVGEVIRRVIGKVISWTVNDNLTDVLPVVHLYYR